MARPTKYSKDDKHNAAVQYMLCGSQKKTAEITGIPRKTLSYWIENDQDFQALYKRAQDQNLKQYDAKTSRLIDKALVKLEQALDSDKMFSPRELATVQAILYDKRAASRQMPSSYNGKTDAVAQLKGLAETFKQIAADNNNNKQAHDDTDKPGKINSETTEETQSPVKH